LRLVVHLTEVLPGEVQDQFFRRGTLGSDWLDLLPFAMAFTDVTVAPLDEARHENGVRNRFVFHAEVLI